MDKNEFLDYEYPDLGPVPSKIEAEWVLSYSLSVDLWLMLLEKKYPLSFVCFSCLSTTYYHVQISVSIFRFFSKVYQLNSSHWDIRWQLGTQYQRVSLWCLKNARYVSFSPKKVWQYKHKYFQPKTTHFL